VSLVCILDADKEGLLRSETSIVQTVGRAARNAHGRVILYADVMTRSINAAVAETNRRRKLQLEYNEKHGIIPQTVIKDIRDVIDISSKNQKDGKKQQKNLSPKDKEKLIEQLSAEMRSAASKLEFEKAAFLRDKIKELRQTK
jgi:excinuclease ABC subunit B